MKNVTLNNLHECSLCGNLFHGLGNSPQPLKENCNDRCCDDCNKTKVIPERIRLIMAEMN